MYVTLYDMNIDVRYTIRYEYGCTLHYTIRIWMYVTIYDMNIDVRYTIRYEYRCTLQYTI